VEDKNRKPARSVHQCISGSVPVLFFPPSRPCCSAVLGTQHTVKDYEIPSRMSPGTRVQSLRTPSPSAQRADVSTTSTRAIVPPLAPFSSDGPSIVATHVGPNNKLLSGRVARTRGAQISFLTTGNPLRFWIKHSSPSNYQKLDRDPRGALKEIVTIQMYILHLILGFSSANLFRIADLHRAADFSCFPRFLRRAGSISQKPLWTR
jgi:hypothetical protein